MLKAKTIAALLLAGAATPALADPFVQVGDRGLKQDIQTMKAAGLISGPIDQWPIAWEQVDAGLLRAGDGRQLPPYVRAAVERVGALSDFYARPFLFDGTIRATNAPAVARDFNDTAREEVDGKAQVNITSGQFSANLGIHYALDQRGNDYDFSPSQVAVTFGNWAMYAGYTVHWSGPGENGALLWSNSARAIPNFGFKVLEPKRSSSKLLRWLGPISFDIWFGSQNEPRDFPDTLLIGTRFSFEPAPGFTIGLNRMQQLCGQGRPCGAGTIAKSFFGLFNADNPTSITTNAQFFDQPGNQIAGFDLSYTRMFKSAWAKVYFEAEAEDEDNFLLEQWGRTVGLTASGPWGIQGANWRVNFEYANTLASQITAGMPLLKKLGNKRYPTSMYNNVLYYSGYTYNVKPIGYWTDGDAHNFAWSAELTDAYNRRFYGSVRAVNLNISNTGNPPIQLFLPEGQPWGQISYRVSANNEVFTIMTIGTQWPTRWGDFNAEFRYQTDSPNTPGYRDPQPQFEFGYRIRF